MIRLDFFNFRSIEPGVEPSDGDFEDLEEAELLFGPELALAEQD
jgi:hypothetical protein